MNSFSEDFGDISENDKLSRLYAKTHFLTNALIEYAICLDISWQVVWASIQPSSFDYLIHQKYKEMEKECTSENVHCQLNCAISQGGSESQLATRIKVHLSSFENDPTVQELRHLYNYIKHCGMLHFEGLGAIRDSMFASINGQSIPILSRKRCRVDELEELLYSYHFKFELFFNELVEIIMPDYYKKQEATLDEYFLTLLKMKESLDN